MMVKKILLGLLLYNVFSIFVFAQPAYDVASILQDLKALNTTGAVLYVAAHPDDENTQLIAYLANGLNLKTGYLSATRGDGGQNLIGTEIRESLGLIRTQELLAARRTDGGQQFFSRANDFGYSKHPDETFNKWDKEKVLADFVWAIRRFRPDVMITRFSTIPGITHGHHTASAILAAEAFELSGDSTAFPEQLVEVDVWQPKRLFWNTSSWFFRNSGQTFDPDKYVKVDVGEYNPALGLSYTEIAADSRSMHKSQGFGRARTRGAQYEYLEQLKGTPAAGLLDGLDMGWSRIEGGEEVSKHIGNAIFSFDPSTPTSILPDLILAKEALQKIEDAQLKKEKLKAIDALIVKVTGTYISFSADRSVYVPGDSLKINFEIINRSAESLVLGGVTFPRWNENFIYKMPLAQNQNNQLSFNFVLSKRAQITNPYWLQMEGTEGMYDVANQDFIGKPENDPAISAKVKLKYKSGFIEVEVPVVYKETDRVKAEIVKPISIAPAVTVDIMEKTLIFATSDPEKVQVRVKSNAPNQSGTLKLEAPNGWKVSPEQIDFALSLRAEEQVFEFTLIPSQEGSVGLLKASAQIGNKVYDRGEVLIQYDHIPEQRWFPMAQVRALRLDLVTTSKKIGYIMGAGDEVPLALRQMGCSVDLLEKNDVTAENLKQYDAVMVGIRAFNTVDWLAFKNQELFDYTKNGGTVIVQYNTVGTVTNDLAPYELKLSRDRVTVEQAKVGFLTPNHPVLNTPNKLTAADFDGWVQERGLYFPDQWDHHFDAVFTMHDPGEDPLKGSLLVAPYGEGYYVYTGISFFRELPAGVPGAFRLLANLISLGK